METFVAVLCSARSAAATVVAVVTMRMLLPIAHRLIHPHHTHHHRLLPTPTGFCHTILHNSHHIVLWRHNFDSSISLQSMHVNRMSDSGVVCDCRLDCGGCYQTHYADSLHYQLDAAVHTLTGRANTCCQSFGTQPTLWMTNAPCTMTARSSAPTPNYSTPNHRTYRAQVNRKHWTSNFDQGASQLQVEITLKKEQTTFTTLNQVWNIGSEFVGGLDTLVVPIPLYVNEVKHLVDVGELHTGTRGRKCRKLTYAERVYAAHLLNAFGICTVDIKVHLLRLGDGQLYPWSHCCRTTPSTGNL